MFCVEIIPSLFFFSASCISSLCLYTTTWTMIQTFFTNNDTSLPRKLKHFVFWKLICIIIFLIPKILNISYTYTYFLSPTFSHKIFQTLFSPYSLLTTTVQTHHPFSYSLSSPTPYTHIQPFWIQISHTSSHKPSPPHTHNLILHLKFEFPSKAPHHFTIPSFQLTLLHSLPYFKFKLHTLLLQPFPSLTY